MSWSMGRPFGFPVQIHASALVLLLLLVLGGDGRSSGIVSGVWLTAVVLLSVLVHELGHAFVARRFGLGPVSIVLHGFGGLARFSRRPTHSQGVIVGLAGPVAGLLLGFLALAVLRLLDWRSVVALEILDRLVAVNVFWSLFNLLPMFPLDGGQVLWHLLADRVSPTDARRWVRRTSMTIALAGGLLALFLKAYFLALISLFIWRQNRTQ